MSEKILRKWVEALESGDFEQGRGRLRRSVFGNPKYCCLGVADKIFDLHVPENKGVYDDHFQSFLGISSGHESKYVNMNDGSGSRGQPASFTEIAAQIRKDYNL